MRSIFPSRREIEGQIWLSVGCDPACDIDCTSLKKLALKLLMQIHKPTDIKTNKLHMLDALRDLDALSERKWFIRTIAHCCKSIRKGWRDNYFIIVCFKCVKAYWLSSKYKLKMCVCWLAPAILGLKQWAIVWKNWLILCPDYNDVQGVLSNQLTETNVTSHITWVFTQTQFMSEMFLSLRDKYA